jgi:hypothetical protein
VIAALDTTSAARKSIRSEVTQSARRTYEQRKQRKSRMNDRNEVLGVKKMLTCDHRYVIHLPSSRVLGQK